MYIPIIDDNISGLNIGDIYNNFIIKHEPQIYYNHYTYSNIEKKIQIYIDNSTQNDIQITTNSETVFDSYSQTEFDNLIVKTSKFDITSPSDLIGTDGFVLPANTVTVLQMRLLFMLFDRVKPATQLTNVEKYYKQFRCIGFIK